MSTTSQVPSLTQIALGDLKHELSSTRRMLESLPEEHLSWKPHPKSMSLGGLAQHLANLPYWQLLILRDSEMDLAAAPPPLSEPRNRDEVLERFTQNAAELREALEQVTDAALMEMWTLRRGDQVILAQPRVAVLRGMGLSHMIHHRGQLSVYLRLLEVDVPGMYGPSADERRE
jgi:uncharacterized damage-inducible protein DinB